MQSHILRQPGEFFMIPTAANRQPALVEYRRDQDGVHRAYAIQILTLTAQNITRVAMFLDPALVAAFGLPPALPAATTGPMARQ